MVTFSETEYLQIHNDPLQPRIQHLRHPLQSAVEKHQARFTVADGSSEDERATAIVIAQLLSTLVYHKVADKLRSAQTKATVSSELYSLLGRIEPSGDINVAQFMPLAALVAQNASDVDTWKAVLDLIVRLKVTTPDRSIEPSFGGTPRTYSSASHQGSETRRRLLEPAIKQELHDCTYEHVGGFWEKYFEGKKWVRKSDEVYEKMKHEHRAGRWAGIPHPPTEQAVWIWWLERQQQYLQESRGVYHTTASKMDISGTDGERQIDIFMKHRDVLPEDKHHFADVRVVGELKSSRTDAAAKFLQLARYVRDVFETQPTRRFVPGFLLLGSSMELCVFDRSGAYSAAPFDIHDEPVRFIRAMSGYTLMSDDELGLDTFIEREGGKQFVTVAESGQRNRRQLQLEASPIAVQTAIVCRGTSCYRTVDGKHVVKFSWMSDKRLAEAEHLRNAQEKGVKGVARLFGEAAVTTVAKLREGLTFSTKRKFRADPRGTGVPYASSSSVNSPSVRALDGTKNGSGEGRVRLSKKSRSNSQTSKLGQKYTASQNVRDVPSTHETQDLGDTLQTAAQRLCVVEEEKFQNRTLSCLTICPAGRALSTFESVPELLRVLRDAIKAHRSLYMDGKILHRDVSKNNIIITDPYTADGFSGMLIDMDLAINVDDMGNNERSGAPRMTGTLKYMAIEVVELAFRDAQRGLDHTYRYDLESFFYIFLDICINHSRPKSKQDPLHGWYTGSYQDIAFTKRGQMERGGFEGSFIKNFLPDFQQLKHLARSLRDVLFHEVQLYTSTPRDPASLYDPVMKAFDSAIEQLRY